MAARNSFQAFAPINSAFPGSKWAVCGLGYCNYLMVVSTNTPTLTLLSCHSWPWTLLLALVERSSTYCPGYIDMQKTHFYGKCRGLRCAKHSSSSGHKSAENSFIKSLLCSLFFLFALFFFYHLYSSPMWYISFLVVLAFMICSL